MNCVIRGNAIAVVLAVAFQFPISAADKPSSRDERHKLVAEVFTVLTDHYYRREPDGTTWTALREQCEQLVVAAPNEYEAHMALRKVIATLRDSHTHYDLPPKLHKPGEKPMVHNAGLSVERIDNQILVREVLPGSEAA